MTSRNTRRKSAFPTALASAAVLASLLAACATPGGGSGAEPDAIHRHALVRTAPPAPSWSALHEQLGKAAAGIAGVELGKVDTAGFHVQIPVADGFASGSAQIRPALGRALDALAPALGELHGILAGAHRISPSGSIFSWMRRRARRNMRDTCTCEMPSFFAISTWVMPSR